MQLFITDFDISGNIITVDEERVVYQLLKVFRASKGYIFFIQAASISKPLKRYQVCVSDISKSFIRCEILLVENLDLPQKKLGIICSILNKFEKMETIVQKLSEIGVPEIVFYPSERSVVREISSNKMERLQKISVEAVEQSKGFFLPKIHFVENISQFLDGKNLLVFDGNGENHNNLDLPENTYGIIGPEGGFSERDLEVLQPFLYRKLSLGQTVLRAETAAIVAGWILKNS